MTDNEFIRLVQENRLVFSQADELNDLLSYKEKPYFVSHINIIKKLR